VHNSRRPAIGKKFNAAEFLPLFQILEYPLSIVRPSRSNVMHQALEFVIDGVVKKCTVSQVIRTPKNTGSDADRSRARVAGLG
jgi:hypothetical protein